MRSARWAWGTASSVPSSTQPEPDPDGAVARTDGVDVGLATVPFSAAVRMTSPATTPGSQRARWASEPKRPTGQCPEHQGGPQRHRRHRVALRLQQEAELHQAVAGATVGLGDGEPEQVAVGQRLPQVAVDAVVAGLDGGDALGIDQAREQPRRCFGDCQLLVGHLEVHQAPSPAGAGTNTGNDSSSS